MQQGIQSPLQEECVSVTSKEFDVALLGVCRFAERLSGEARAGHESSVLSLIHI